MGGALVSAVLVTPLDVVKTRVQAQQGTSVGVTRMFFNIASREGSLALWNGLGLSMLSAVPTVGVYLLAYDAIKANLLSSHLGQEMVPVLAGVGARSLAVCLSAPLENARTMAQADGAWLQFQHSIQKHGMRTLWRGFWPYLARDVPFSALYWSLLEGSRSTVVGMIMGRKVSMKELPELSSQLSAPDLLKLNFGCGLTAGAVASALTTPVDVVYVKTVTSKSRASPIAVARKLYRTEGAPAFFKGLTPRVMKVAPSCAMVIMAYEILKRIQLSTSALIIG